LIFRQTIQQQRDQQQNQITYSRGVAKMPMNKSGNWYVVDARP